MNSSPLFLITALLLSANTAPATTTASATTAPTAKAVTKSESNIATKNADSKTANKKNESKTTDTKQPETAEYKIILDENYETFRTRTYQKLELSENCFKNEKPNCMAYSVSLEKGPKVTLNQFGSNNKAAMNCKNMGGKNLVALDKDRNEFGFCKFGDGSMVTIWSMYFKTNPAPTIK